MVQIRIEDQRTYHRDTASEGARSSARCARFSVDATVPRDDWTHGERAGMRTQRYPSREQAGRPPTASPDHHQHGAGEGRTSSAGFSVSHGMSYGILPLDAPLRAGLRVTITSRRTTPGWGNTPSAWSALVPSGLARGGSGVASDLRWGLGRVRDLDEPLRKDGLRAVSHRHDRGQASRRSHQGRSTECREEGDR